MASQGHHASVLITAMRSGRRAAPALTAVVATCLAAAGCGGGGGSGSDPLSGMSAKQVVSKAVADLKSAR